MGKRCLSPIKSLEPKALDHDCHRWYFGTGLFIGLGYSLASGPAALLIGFVSWYFNVLCRSECRRAFLPIPRFLAHMPHVSRFIDESVGFTVATNLCFGLADSLSNELIGCALTISYWNQTVKCGCLGGHLCFPLWY
nr:CNT_HP1_G0042530.mRNA.1.CDS.1 [Saccharomyces cerevisiae]